MPNKSALAISALLISVISGGLFVELVQANPNPLATLPLYNGDISIPDSATPPAILLLPPHNQSSHSTNNITFKLNISLSGTPLKFDTVLGADNYTTDYIYPRLREIYFETDWQETKTYVERDVEPNQTIRLNLTDIPEGNHSVTIYAVGWRPYQILNISQHGTGKIMRYNGYSITGSSVIDFTIENAYPTVSAPEPLLTNPAIIASVVLVAVACAGLLLYIIKRK